MSLSINPSVKLFKVIDPEINSGQDPAIGILIGSDRVDYRTISSTNSTASSLGFSIRPPSNVYMSRKVLLRMRVTLTFTGTAPIGQNLLSTGFDSFRSWPLATIMENLQIKLNGRSFSIPQRDLVKALMWVNSKENQMEKTWSTTPTMLDQSQEYSDLTNFVRNPLGGYGESPEDAQMPRGGFVYESVINTNTDATIVAILTEPLMISPNSWQKGNDLGYFYLQTYDVDINWSSDLNRMWSHALNPGVVIDTINVALDTNPKLLVKYMNPNSAFSQIPNMISIPFSEIARFKTDQSVLMTPLTDPQIAISSDIELQSIPASLIIFAKRRNSEDTFLTTDTFLGITNLSITWNSVSGLLAGSDQRQLYQLSVQNGLEMSFSQFSGRNFFLSGSDIIQIGGVGSVVVINPSRDLGLPVSEVTGSLSTVHLQVNATIKNITSTTSTTNDITPTLYVIPQYIGTVTFDQSGQITRQQGIISRQDVVEAVIKMLPEYDFNMLQTAAMYGGVDFFQQAGERIKKFFEEDIPKGLKFAEKNLLPIAKALIPVLLPLLGLGDIPKGKKQGGRLLTRAQLAKKLLR
ncbi:hypothetical protein LCGC14_0704740 [marine sediment metagenome]|uniref:Uncharacterized protein n=1 Tax=marine sediment metagenome TaxID=412755 RepID=A0A0F9R2A4_9ZZZZ|nr:hypothetical protein [archaeon]